MIYKLLISLCKFLMKPELKTSHTTLTSQINSDFLVPSVFFLYLKTWLLIGTLGLYWSCRPGFINNMADKNKNDIQAKWATIHLSVCKQSCGTEQNIVREGDSAGDKSPPQTHLSLSLCDWCFILWLSLPSFFGCFLSKTLTPDLFSFPGVPHFVSTQVSSVFAVVFDCTPDHFIFWLFLNPRTVLCLSFHCVWARLTELSKESRELVTWEGSGGVWDAAVCMWVFV